MHGGWADPLLVLLVPFSQCARTSAEDMYERIFTMKFLPPGRGLWAMGTPLTEEK